MRACRPRQWLKNAVIVFAPAAAGAMTRMQVVSQVGGAVIAFCLISSSTYLINDLRDREADRLHPRKRFRPLASGELSPRRAIIAALAMMLGGLLAAALVRPALAAVAAAYLVLTVSYTMWWRHVVLADILAVAGGFVLRALAGGVATDVSLSRAFLLVTSACAVFLVAGKRYAELVRAGSLPATRRTLLRYSRRSLSGLITASAAVGCVAYALWAFGRRAPQPALELSLIPLAMWLARYATVLGRGEGEAPEDLVLRDGPLLALEAVWGILFVAGIYGPG